MLTFWVLGHSHRPAGGTGLFRAERRAVSFWLLRWPPRNCNVCRYNSGVINSASFGLLIAAAGDRRTPYFYRTEDGAEVDLLFERGGQVEMLIEIKRSTAPEVSRGFRSALDLLKPRQSYLVHGGSETWPLDGKITATSVPDLVQRLLRG